MYRKNAGKQNRKVEVLFMKCLVILEYNFYVSEKGGIFLKLK